MRDFNKMEWTDIVKLNFGNHDPIDLRTARLLIDHFGGYGSTRVYATFKDGVYKGQIDSVKSEQKLDELISAYNVTLTACPSNADPNEPAAVFQVILLGVTVAQVESLLKRSKV